MSRARCRAFLAASRDGRGDRDEPDDGRRRHRARWTSVTVAVPGRFGHRRSKHRNQPVPVVGENGRGWAAPRTTLSRRDDDVTMDAVRVKEEENHRRSRSRSPRVKREPELDRERDDGGPGGGVIRAHAQGTAVGIVETRATAVAHVRVRVRARARAVVIAGVGARGPYHVRPRRRRRSPSRDRDRRRDGPPSRVRPEAEESIPAPVTRAASSGRAARPSDACNKRPARASPSTARPARASFAAPPSRWSSPGWRFATSSPTPPRAPAAWVALPQASNPRRRRPSRVPGSKDASSARAGRRSVGCRTRRARAFASRREAASAW